MPPCAPARACLDGKEVLGSSCKKTLLLTEVALWKWRRAEGDDASGASLQEIRLTWYKFSMYSRPKGATHSHLSFLNAELLFLFFSFL